MLLILCIKHETLHDLVTISELSLHLANPGLLLVNLVQILVTLLLHLLKLIVEVFWFLVGGQHEGHQ